MRGRLITIEGLDGSGKTTLADALADALRVRGRDVALLREPGGVELSERIRALVKDRRSPSTRAPRRCSTPRPAPSSWPQRVEPALAAGTWVLLDRFVDSSLAYQGVGRALGSRGGARRQPLRHGGCGPTARCCCAPTPATRAARQACAARRPTGSSARTTPSSTPSPAPTTRWRRPSPSASACSTRAPSPRRAPPRRRAALADLG
jgi:dTMP kinase